MTKVLYIIGKGRSGSTLIDTVLGQTPGVVSTGELNKLFTWGFDERVRCGCGEPIPSCPFWNRVLDAAWQGRPPIHRMIELQNAVQRWVNVPRLLAQSPTYPTGWAILDELADAKSRLYHALADVSGASVVVDSSKWPAEPAALGVVPDIDVLLLHLVRDPRAVVNSWQRHKRWDDREGHMPRYGVPYSMASYWARNLVTEIVSRRHVGNVRRLRYEDFVFSPAEELEGVLEFCGIQPTSLPVSQSGQVEMKVCHTAGGNPGRMRTGNLTIAPDELWVDEMSVLAKVGATLLGLPFLLRYGYLKGRR